MIPLILKLKKAKHKELVKAQDIIVEEIYRFFENAVIHGGTAIWRCYQGNRFSEDIDVYIARDEKRINALFESLRDKGFGIKKKKIGEKSLYSVMSYNRETVMLEALFKKAKGSLKEYETAEGNFITVYTLKPEELIIEKAEAYLKRNKIRDIYDVFFLLRYVNNREAIIKQLGRLIRNFKKPIDETDLKVLIIQGIVPSWEKMLEYIKNYIRWEKKNT
ncbi:MAG: nucleotidyl transferase AbiEii/AbiGii toxin family protein [Candidatus Woesearchaeota archaeon]